MRLYIHFLKLIMNFKQLIFWKWICSIIWFILSVCFIIHSFVYGYMQEMTTTFTWLIVHSPLVYVYFLNIEILESWYVLIKKIHLNMEKKSKYPVRVVEWLLTLHIINKIILNRNNQKHWITSSPVSMTLSSVLCKCNWSGLN